MFDDIIMNIFRSKALEFNVELVDSIFTKTENNKIYMYRGSIQDFYWKKFTHESLYVLYQHLDIEIIKIRQHFSNILKYDNHSNDTKGKIYHWLDF